MIFDSWLTDASASVTVGTVIVAVWRSTCARSGRKLAAEVARADKWEHVATTQEQTIDDLRDQVRDLRTVALIDERIDARLDKDNRL